MRAAILGVGGELLGADRVDTNSLELTAVLNRFGIRVGEKRVVADDESEIAAAVRGLSDRFSLLLVTGGLGPTQDDVTREAVASALGRRLSRDRRIVRDLRAKFASFGITMPKVNEKQADVIEGAEVLNNRRGTAPGMKIDHETGTVFLFPGVPAELEGLVSSALVPWLEATAGEAAVQTKTFKMACIPESTLEERLGDYYRDWGEEGVALLPSLGQVIVRLTAVGTEDERREWLDPRCRALRRLLGRRLFSEDETATLEEVVGAKLAEADLTVATAESCTGGLVAERLTRVAGSSRYFLGAIVSYANEVKTRVLGIDERVLAQHGAVSEEVARAMALAARRLLGADLAAGITGIAGPAGGSADKPVGTVHLAVAGPEDSSLEHRRLHLPGDRERIRWVTSQWALEMLRHRALEASAG